MGQLKDIARGAVKSIPPLYRQYNRARGWRIHDADVDIEYLSVGGVGAHDYGAWVVPKGLLDQDSVVYSIGVGEDISFDADVIRKYGCTVFAYDPTPLAVAYLERVHPDERFVFSQVGLAAVDGEATFCSTEGADGSFVMPGGNISAVGADGPNFPVKRLSTLMLENGHQKIDLLKMDIEGFEYSVIDDMLASSILPRCLIVEFHHHQRQDPDSTRRAVRQLKETGYKLFWVSELGAEYAFYMSPDKTEPVEHD